MSLRLKREIGSIRYNEHLGYTVGLSYYNQDDFDKESGFIGCTAEVIVPEEVGDSMTMQQVRDEAVRRWNSMKKLL